MNSEYLLTGLRTVFALLLIFPSAGLSQTPDQVLYNGKVLTVDESFSTASAIAISGDRILAVGDTADIRAMAGDDTEQTDLEGRTVIPGIIDNHIHYLRGTNFAAYELRIHGITSRQEVLNRITAKGKELGPGKWIFIIGGWHEQQFADKAGGFTTAELNRAAPENPVFIQRTYSAFYTNRLAAEILSAEHPEWFDEDGVIRVDNRFGRTVMYAALEYFPFAQTLNGRMEEVRAFNDYLNSMGVTTAYDVGYLDGSYKPVIALHEADQLTLRVFYAARYWADSPRTATAAAELLDREAPFQRDSKFGMFGIGEHVYGLLHDSTNSDAPIADEIYDEWEKIARSAAKNGWYINEHAMQDSTANRMLSIAEEIGAEYPTQNLRWTLGHVDKIKRPTVLRAKELGWNITLANHTVKVPIEGMASPPVRMIQDTGILWGMGSDGTIVATYNPFHVIWEYTAGKVFPDIEKLKPDEVITREEALIAHTRSNAYILFMEDDIGTLEAGKFADLVVLDRDYLTMPIDELLEIRPVLTMVGGKVVYRTPD
ncbi:MAG: amidohydrolase [Woeseiaceae bacterium]